MAELEQGKINEFRRSRQQLLNISSQKQQMQFQASAMQSALAEIKESKPKTVYKAVGNILIEKDAKTVEKELKDAKEGIDVRVEALQKQEDSLVNRLNKLKSQIEESTGDLGLGAPEKGKGKKKKGK